MPETNPTIQNQPTKPLTNQTKMAPLPNQPSTGQTPVAPPTTTVKPKLDQFKKAINFQNWFKTMPKSRKIGLIIAGIMAFLLAVTLLLALITGKMGGRGKEGMVPSPTPEPEEEEAGISNPSRYATDSAVLGIEEEVKTLDQKISATDLKESKLQPPSLDFEIGF